MEPLNDLPESVREIAEVIGRDSALKLIDLLPKTESPKQGKTNVPIMYVPKAMSLENKWARFYLKTIGWDKALRLIRVFGGEILTPANCRFVESRQRDRDIKACLQAGENIDLIAAAFDVPRRHVLKLQRAEQLTSEKPPEELNAEGIEHVGCN